MVVKSRHTRLSIAELRRRRCFYLPVRFGNQKILLASARNPFPEGQKIRVVIETEEKVPPHKQFMQMQMGKTPQTKQTDRRIYILDTIQNLNENEYCEVFEVIG